MTDGRALEAGERGATPVVAIVLVIALVVLVSAGVAQYVFGLDLLRSQEVGPQVSFSQTYEGDTLTLRHESGDTLETAQLSVATPRGDGATFDPETHPDSIGASDTITITGVNDDDRVLLIWRSPDTGDSYIVYEWNGSA